MAETLNAAASHHLPAFITGPGESDVLLTVMTVFLLAAVLAIGSMFLWLHSLPERMAHKARRTQMEIVAVLCLIALFSHIHLFWIIALLLAMIELPDVMGPIRLMASSLNRLANGETVARRSTDDVSLPNDPDPEPLPEAPIEPMAATATPGATPATRENEGGGNA